MAKQIPTYIIKEVEALNKALANVIKHSRTIESWVNKNTNVDGDDFFYDNRLDIPYEFDAEATIEALQEALAE